jgi:type II secretory pathway pseudopilin PulG
LCVKVIVAASKALQNWRKIVSDRSIRRPAFTLVELLAVTATIAILAALLFPILSKAKIKAQRTACFSNLHQLGLAWVMYYNDNRGYLAESYPINNPDVWVQGDMSNLNEATNVDLIRQGKLYYYNQNPAIYHCPTDRGVNISGQAVSTVRSYSMNSFMGGREPGIGPIPVNADPYVQFFSKDSELQRPSELWVLVDEDERSINDGFFVTDPDGRMWVDFPAISAARHSFTYGLNFGDGHSELWRYRDPRSFKVFANRTEQSGNQDLARLARASTVRKKAP